MIATRNRLPAKPRTPTQRFLVAVHDAMAALEDMMQEPGREPGLACLADAGIHFNLEIARGVIGSGASPADPDVVDVILAAR